jgi:cellulose biosynthesis protein BcsQ
MRVLFLEDCPGPSDEITRTLQHHGHEVTPIGSEAALARAGHASDYDLLIVDLDMRSVDPFAFLGSQARMGQTARALLLSGSDALSSRAIALGYRERQILARPPDRPRLLTWLADYAHRALAGPHPSDPRRPVIAVTGPRPNSGKTTLSAHLAGAAARHGLKVATFDLDNRTHSLTQFVEARRRQRSQRRITTAIPHHRVPNLAETGLDALWHDIERQRRSAGIVILDCPSGASPVTRLAVQQADILLTLVTDIHADLTDLAELSIPNLHVRRPGPFAGMVMAARGGHADHRTLDWRLVRNRHRPPSNQERGEVSRLEAGLSRVLGLRPTRGMAERPIHRDLLARGLTLFDLPSDALLSRSGRRGLGVDEELEELRAMAGLDCHQAPVARARSARNSVAKAVPIVAGLNQ